MPRCKNENCKNKFIAKVFLQKHCMENMECLNLELEYKKEKAKNKERDVEEKIAKMKVRVKAPSRKLDLQKEVNKLSRMIDNNFKFLCIDCGREYGKQQDAAHLHNVQGNENIRFNLHNLHSATSYCNKYCSEHKGGYELGIKERYGLDYWNRIKFDIPLKYKYLGLLDDEIIEKLAIVRKLIRTFNTFVLEDGVQAREMFNNIIGIYK